MVRIKPIPIVFEEIVYSFLYFIEEGDVIYRFKAYGGIVRTLDRNSDYPTPVKQSFYALITLLLLMSQVINANIEGSSQVFFIRGGRTAIVDAGFSGSERNIMRALKIAGIPKEQVSVIIITHAHCDHYGSLQALRAMLNVPVIAGWPDAQYMEKGGNAPVINYTGKHAGKESLGPKVGSVKADVIVKDSMSLSSYGIDSLVINTPTHTAGSLCIVAGSGDCATGDFLAGLFTGEPEVVKHSLKKLVDAGAKRFYPSHGPCIEAATVLNMFFEH